MAQDDEEEEEIGPKLIQWNGTVNGQRQIRIEMPGVPGRIEIPRVYRDRVAIVEPPNAVSGWRVAVLRMYGKGHVSFTLRWGPSSRPTGRVATHREGPVNER